MTRRFAAIALACLLALAAPARAAETFTTEPAPRTVTLTGFTRARADMALVAEESGRVRRVAADVGDAIGRGGVFADQDPTFLRLDLEANQVQQQRQASRVAWLDTEAGRYRTLVAKRTAEQSALDKLEQDLDQARFELQSLKVQAEVLAERLRRLAIKAPAGWLVTERLVEPGQWVAAGTVVGRVGDYTAPVVPFALSPAEYQALRKALGHNPEGLSLDLPGLGLRAPARVHTVSPAFDPATRKIAVELAVSLPPAKRRGGLRALLELATDDESGAVLVPASAVTERYDQHWLTRPDGSQAAVVVLGPGPGEDTLRVASPEMAPGQEFLVRPGNDGGNDGGNGAGNGSGAAQPDAGKTGAPE